MKTEFPANPLLRVVVVKTIERLFCEPLNRKRSPRRAFELMIHPILGICRKTVGNYRKPSDDLLLHYPMPDHLKFLFQLHVIQIVRLPPAEAAKVQTALCNFCNRAIDLAKRSKTPINAASILRHLTVPETEPVV